MAFPLDLSSSAENGRQHETTKGAMKEMVRKPQSGGVGSPLPFQTFHPYAHSHTLSLSSINLCRNSQVANADSGEADTANSSFLLLFLLPPAPLPTLLVILAQSRFFRVMRKKDAAAEMILLFFISQHPLHLQKQRD